MGRYLQHLEKGNKRFEKCEHSHNGQWCGLGGYPIIDCLDCKTYKERSVENGIYIEKYSPQSRESLLNELLSKMEDKMQDATSGEPKHDQAEKIKKLKKLLSENENMFSKIE